MQGVEQSCLTTTASSPEIDALVDDFNRDGFCILRGFIHPDKMSKWKEEFSPLFDYFLKHYAGESFRGKSRYYVTLPFKPPFNDPEIFEHDTLVALLERVAGKDFVMCQLATDTPLEGSEYQDIHADCPHLFPESDVETPSFQLALNFPLCDVTTTNGPVEIARGTHKLKKEEGMKKINSGEVKLEPIEMKLGDVMLRDVRGLHRGTPNKTDIPRPMVVIGYSRKWLFRPEVSIKIAKKDFDKLTPRARNMLRFNQIVDELPEIQTPETYKSFAF